MANIKSNEKRLRQNIKRNLNNKGQKTKLKTNVKNFHKEINLDNLGNVYSQADRLARKGIISTNRARRLKSRNAAVLNKTQVTAVEGK
ncbi:30S ribosomal protein S20 [Mycoplasmoides pneumoniae]|uniref:Small ribosomal subunit protein bS20 n=2 Tax=Mycoplasmoides pneumoniae TaxID=2104 RepID=A0AAX0S2C1_MYCPM|nr:30S ribosomal protein S20 [Mycoplasmoides pneumoniae]ALA30703.1 30S ribosomal protein S20 [Mycoplasmoides pneumoniae 19294]ALA31808.1 30S ribosomal protein S20 [Mycoplasmoides pneumoniae 39443]ALA36037.1 30S ribosomal protein S20 [Mycoplasmoides pneumoniae FH]ALA36747.1 30S ribosomal protein S20 [Mycoplasmoides pneumoniae M1139]ALA37458.1 30S ribosomal protein S20 [Mycoplasmoides pneumoniae]